jgi:methionyl-tRNA synthetase
MPSSAEKMAELLRLEKKAEELRVSEFETWGGTKVGKELEKGGILFPRIEYDPETKEVKIAKTKRG